MMRCDRCGKGLQVGMNVSHSHVRTKRSYPNLHTFRVPNRGKMSFCTKCLRIVKADVAKSLSSKPEKKETKTPVPVETESKTLQETISSI
jgi:large subunit ribosomal protein L28